MTGGPDTVADTARQIEEEATAWVVRLSGRSISGKEKRELRAWVARSPEHARAIAHYASIWREADALALALDPPESKRAPAGLRLRPAYLAIAVSCACAALLFLFPRSDGAQRYVTEIGAHEQIALPDASKIELNTDSAVLVEYRPDRRIVRLERGEALFDVEPDKERPFEVYADGHRVAAVGTAFSVRKTADEVLITVTEGVVEVRPKTQRASITPSGVSKAGPTRPAVLRVHDAAVLTPQSITIQSLPIAKIDRVLSWRNNVLMFDGEPLEEVVAQLMRYSELRIEFADESLKRVPVGGQFQIGREDLLFQALEGSFPIDVTYKEDRRVVLSRRPD